ncbi:hypothetical protein [Nocardiopsis sp. FIRDI 009]|uniref:hypothetical protein n=1 Tax=Nocardiopsis sp. FIRDI 009 TaxID=714197 RepID=UPI000E27A725|nr:hypothetical protein [Nocardiopsis sp. FIRDI 009]
MIVGEIVLVLPRLGIATVLTAGFPVLGHPHDIRPEKFAGEVEHRAPEPRRPDHPAYPAYRAEWAWRDVGGTVRPLVSTFGAAP